MKPITLCLTLLALPLLGQVTARQGTVTDTRTSEFTSPLVLELPLEKLNAPAPRDLYPFTDQDKFVCDDASIPLILIKKTVTRSHQVKLNLKTSVFVRPSYDRKVTIRYTLLAADGTTLAATDQEISAEEKKIGTDSSTLVVSQEAFDNLFKGETHGKLKLVMTVVSDR